MAARKKPRKGYASGKLVHCQGDGADVFVVLKEEGDNLFLMWLNGLPHGWVSREKCYLAKVVVVRELDKFDSLKKSLHEIIGGLGMVDDYIEDRINDIVSYMRGRE